MKYAFFGTPKFAAIILENLAKAQMAPAIVICNPDKPVGRKKIVTLPPTKEVALKYNIEVAQPENLKSWDNEARLKGYEFAVVAAYAKIIPQRILDLFPKGVIGIHPSFLPKYRGASPIQSAILNGDAKTGVTLYVLDKEVDHGPVIDAETVPIDEHDNYTSLLGKLAVFGGEMLTHKLPEWYVGKIIPKEQDHGAATFTKKFGEKDAMVDLAKDNSLEIYRKIKALNPEPGVYTFIQKDDKKLRVKLLEALYSDNKLVLKKVQVEGKNPTENRRYIDELIKV